MSGELVTADLQAQIRDVLFDTSTGIEILAASIEDIMSLAELRSSNVPRPQGHGMISTGPDWLSGLTVRIPFIVKGASRTEVLTRRDALAEAWYPSDDGGREPFVMQLDGTKYLWWVKPSALSIVFETYTYPNCYLKGVGELTILDPTRYTNTESTVSSGLASTSGGLTYPHGYPYSYGTVTSGSVTVVNDGTVPARFTAKITAGTGGLSGPRITHVESGAVLAFDTLTLNAGEWVELDWWDQTVLLNGVASRSATLVRPLSEWFRLEPGINTVLFGGTGVGTLDVEWRSAWA